jgi:transcriptional regulator with PAS, ATPase and Fis domain
MEPKPVNVRVVAATNRNLAQMVEDGTFRLDLYHRMNVLSLDVPPLCERREDMKSIANAVIHQLGEKGHALKIGKADWQAIDAYGWPGNIRQFIDILKRAAYMQIPVADALATEIRRSSPASDGATPSEKTGIPHLDMLWPTDPDAITPEDEVRKAYMRRCLEVCEGNWTLTAQKLGVAINTLRKWLDA